MAKARRSRKPTQPGDVVGKTNPDAVSWPKWRKHGCTCRSLDEVYVGMLAGFPEVQSRHDHGCPAGYEGAFKGDPAVSAMAKTTPPKPVSEKVEPSPVPDVTPGKRDIPSILGTIPRRIRDQSADQRVFLWADSMWAPQDGMELSPEIVDYALDRLSAARRGLLKARRDDSVTCAQCGKAFTAIRSSAVYCSAACRQRAYRQR